MLNINLPTDILKAALEFSAKKDVRHYLNGVRIERAGRVFNIVATDGHALFCAKYSEQFSDDMQEDFVIPFDAVKKALTGNKAQSITLQVDECQGGYMLGYVSFVPDTTTYPQWRNGLPSDSTIDDGHGQLAHFNPDLLMRCVKAGKHLGIKSEPIDITPLGARCPAMVTFGHLQDCFAIVMPLRKDNVPAHDLKIIRDMVTVSQAQAAKAA